MQAIAHRPQPPFKHIQEFGPHTDEASLCGREMQEKAAEDAAEYMNAEQEAYTLAQMPHNMSVALATTYDSCGWPHDRSPFIKARSALGGQTYGVRGTWAGTREAADWKLGAVKHSNVW